MPLTRDGFDRLISKQGRRVKISRAEEEAYTIAVVVRGRWAMRVEPLAQVTTEDIATVIMPVTDLRSQQWPLPPKKHDEITFDDGYHVVYTVYPLYIGEELIGFRMEVSG